MGDFLIDLTARLMCMKAEHMADEEHLEYTHSLMTDQNAWRLSTWLTREHHYLILSTHSHVTDQRV